MPKNSRLRDGTGIEVASLKVKIKSSRRKRYVEKFGNGGDSLVAQQFNLPFYFRHLSVMSNRFPVIV